LEPANRIEWRLNMQPSFRGVHRRHQTDCRHRGSKMENAIGRARQSRLRVAGAYLASATYATLAAGSAQAACVVAGLSGSPSDASTSQALELIRDRRMQVAQSCPAGTVPSAAGCVPASPAAAAPPPAPAAAPAAPARKRAPRPAAAPAPAAAPGPYYGSIKDDVVEPVRIRPIYGIWAEGYGDHDRRNDVGPDGQSIRFTSYGFLSGIDHTYMRSPREGVMIGALAGYNDTHGKFSGGTDSERKSQDLEGAVIGLYGSYFHSGVALDLLAKADIFDLDQRGLECGVNTGSTDVTNYVIAGNIYHRRSYGHYWLEPTAGFRFVDSQFGSGAAALGFDDGHSLRLQAGLRVGSDWVGHDGRLWSVSFLSGLYSDVVVDGFTAAGTTVVESDEGEVRALGQLRAKVTTRDGLSYYGQAEVRGGADYFGVGGKLGLRYEW